jgi:HAD superfamily hydrolase (TIGR01509 family)
MNSEVLLPAAAIFDMDGVLVDSNPFHIRKWIDLLNERQVPFDREELAHIALGPRNRNTIRHYFGDSLSEADVHQLSEELEEKYRAAIRPHAKPLPGLEPLIKELHQADIPMAVASAGMRKNIEFMVDVLGLRPYFRYLISGEEMPRSKPDPEIYLKTAAALGVKPAECAAFEDSFVGVEAVKRAGMKCVAVASTFPVEELRRKTHADLIVTSFEDLRLKTLQSLFRVVSSG